MLGAAEALVLSPAALEPDGCCGETKSCFFFFFFLQS